MYTSKHLGDKQYSTKAELFAALKENKDDIFAIKKMANKHCDGNFTPHAANKAYTASDSTAKELDIEVIGNTYLWLDSHSDVHIPGIFTKSIKENQKNILHLHDHVNMVTSKVGIPSLIYEKTIPWRDLGVHKEGTTICVAMKSKVMDVLNSSVFYQYNKGLIQQHSVSMQYLDLEMCVNSQDGEYKEEYAAWLKYYPMIGNQNKADELGYFFAVTQAKLKEISAVTMGSNELTPTLELTQDEPNLLPLPNTKGEPNTFIELLNKTILLKN